MLVECLISMENLIGLKTYKIKRQQLKSDFGEIVFVELKIPFQNLNSCRKGVLL